MIKYIFKDIREKVIKEENDRILYLDNNIEFNDFLDKLMLTENIILKEEKESLLFYSMLTNKEKEIFGINSYFDCIDISYNYYSLMGDLYRNNIHFDDLKLEKWQQKYMKAVYSVHNKMIKNADSKKIVPRYLKYYNTKYNERFIKNFDKVVVINKMYTDKEVLTILNNLSIDVEYHLYVYEKDYNKEKNILENITMLKTDNKIEAINTKDEISMLMYLTSYLTKTDEEIVINDIDSKAMYNNINKNLLKWRNENYLNQKNSYKILRYLYDIENSLDNLSKNIELKHIYFAILDSDFLEIFEIEKEDVNKIKKMYSSTRKYIDINEFSFINKILNESVEDICNLIAAKFIDEKDEFLEAITEINVLEDFNFKKYIKTKKEMYKLILKYLDAKKIKLTPEDTKFEITKVDGLESLKYILLNAQSAADFNIKEYILNSKQRKDLGLLNTRDFKYVIYYDYIRKIYLSSYSKIIYIKNIDEDMDIKSVFNGLLLANDIETKTIEYSTKEIVSHLNYINGNEDLIKINEDFLTENDAIYASSKDFENLKINGYNISTFMEDILSYMLVKATKESNVLEFIKPDDTSISNIVIGNIIHSIIETCLSRKVLLYDEVVKIKDEVLNSYKDYIKKEYYVNYDKLLFSPVLYEVVKYLKENEGRDILVEEEIKTNIFDVDISMKLDILAKLDDGYMITDIKSGSKKSSNKIYNYQLQAYKTFLEYTKGLNINNLKIYYPFDSSYEIVRDSDFSIKKFEERLKYVKSMDRFLISGKSLDYNFINIIREIKKNEG